MKTRNMKRILSCFALSASYFLANAQGIIVYKTDGTQIKVPFEQLDYIAPYESDANPDNPSVEPISAADLVGEWGDGGLGFSNGYSLSFNDGKVTIKLEDNVTQEPYTLENNVVSFVMDDVTYRTSPGLAGGKSVMIVKQVIPAPSETKAFRAEAPANGETEELAFVLVKEGETIKTSKSDIQGQWLCWWTMNPEEDPIVRMSLKFDGDNFEAIITPWGQKYTGTYTYANGMVTFNVKAGYTSRTEGTGGGSMWGDLDPVTLEAPWRTLYEEYWHFIDGGAFVATGDEAFGLVLLPGLYTRKK